MLYLLLCNLWFSNRLREQLHCRSNGGVECRRLVHKGFARGCALNVAAKRFDSLEHLIGGALRCRLKGKAIHNVGDAAQVLVLISGTSIDVNSNAREVTWKSFGGDANAVWEGSYFVEFRWVLCLVSSPPKHALYLIVKNEWWPRLRHLTFWIPSTIVAYFLLAIDARCVCTALHDGSARDNARDEEDLSIFDSDVAVACPIFGRR